MRDQETIGLYQAYQDVYALQEEQQDLVEISQKLATRAYAQSATGEFEGHDDARDVKRTDNLRKHIERKFGPEAAKNADRHADAKTFGRKDPRTGKRQPKPQSRFQNPNKYRTTKSGKMHGQDQNALKVKLQRRASQAEEFDLYDIILSHLLDEGYADTQEAATAIMTNMSEEWKQSIVEEVLDEETTDDRQRKYEQAQKTKARRAEARNNARRLGLTGNVTGVGYVSGSKPENINPEDRLGGVHRRR